MRFAMRRGLLMLCLVAACGTGDDPPRTSGLSVALSFPGTLNADVTEVTLDIFDEFAMCDDEIVVGGSVIQTETLEPGVPTEINVSAGFRVFHATGLDFGTPVAEGCAREFLRDGESQELQIDMVETTGGVADAGPADEAS